MRKKSGILSIFLVFFSNVVFAGDTVQANVEGKAFADAINTTTVKSMGSNIDPSTVPNYEGANVPETGYTSQNIEHAGQAESENNHHSQYIRNARGARPQMSIDQESDPLFEHHREVTDKAHGLSETYAGCENLPTADDNVSLCAEQLVCPDGTCTSEFGQTYEPATDDFNAAHSGLLAISNGGNRDVPELESLVEDIQERLRERHPELIPSLNNGGE